MLLYCIPYSQKKKKSMTPQVHLLKRKQAEKEKGWMKIISSILLLAGRSPAKQTP